MPKKSVENTALRLKAILEVLARQDPSAEKKTSRAEVLRLALEQVPLEGTEAQLLASGVARGERALVTASTKLVKAGWILKEGRAGWSITSQGRSALSDFPDVEHLHAALSGSEHSVTAVTKAEAHSEAVLEEALVVSDAAAEPAASAHGAHADEHYDGPSFPQPNAVAVPGTFGSVLGGADWDPAAEAVQLGFDRSDELWKLSVDLPAGDYEFKAALNRGWDENYGQGAHFDGANYHLEHAGGPMTFLYDHATHTVVTKPDGL
ncbi:glycosidase [Arthrobacter gandavensis]|uniref:pullulanase X25 domain-containing protein n=1 Tax=Arthrobacter gandavensis TaxID=169960 RepID=UPI00188FFA16|nr:winged helix-turn-helix domain-containing protein [Arthrobacter gandavensis]MBF4995361.1 glycosidase [Arthrobacter gandavensis]